MDLDLVIKGRRSIRKYLDKNVEHEKISLILDAGRYAPNSGNKQLWHFIIVEDLNKREQITEACLGQEWMKTAPVFIVVCYNLEYSNRFYDERAEFYGIQDCALASENIMLKAYDIGLSSCFVSLFEENAIKRILKIPDNVKVYCIITIGYGNETSESKRMDLRNIISFEEYKGKKSFGIFPLKKTFEKIKDKFRKK